LIGGWYGTETLGDKAILAGVGAALEAALGPCAVTLMSLHPYVSRQTLAQMPELRGWSIATPEEACAAVAAQDLVVFGGGPMMAIKELAEMEALFSLARDKGIATMIAGCGVGPLGVAHLDAAIGRILELADIRIYRDETSRAAAGRLGLDTARDAVAEDPAFTWLAAARAALPRPQAHDGKVLLLGLRDFPYQDYAREMSVEAARQAARRYEAEVVAALEALAAQRPDLVIRPLPMCTNHFGDDDRWFYRRLLRGARIAAEQLDLSLLGRELPPQDYARAFREADAALTMRFHSVVFALGLELPTVAIDYTLGRGKVTALAERFDLPQQPLTALGRAFLIEALAGALDAPRVAAPDFRPLFPGAVAAALTAMTAPAHEEPAR